MLNRICLMGRIVADPELKSTASGISVTTFRIAVDRNYVAKGGERKADFFDIVAWKATAEFICRNFTKGSLIALDGVLQSREYTAKDGQKRSVIEIHSENVYFTGERRNLDYNPNDYATKPVERTQKPQDQYYQQSINDTVYTPDGDLPF